MNYFDTDKREFAKHFVKYGLIPTDKELPYDASEESAMGEYVHPMKDIERINNQKNKHERNENIQYKTNTNMKRTIKLRESELKRMIAESVKRVLRESAMDDVYSDFDDTAYDRNGKEIHKGNIVVWTDPETGRKTKYEVYEEPSSEMVKLWNKYGECEAFPEECLVVR